MLNIWPFKRKKKETQEVNLTVPVQETNTPLAKTEKTCKACGFMRPIEDFAKRAANPDGHQNICKECQAEARRMKRTADVI